MRNLTSHGEMVRENFVDAIDRMELIGESDDDDFDIIRHQKKLLGVGIGGAKQIVDGMYSMCTKNPLLIMMGNSHRRIIPNHVLTPALR